jgi:putative glycosyltransferase (TIGR04372 family)
MQVNQQFLALKVAVNTWIARKNSKHQLVFEVALQLLAIPCFITSYVLLTFVSFFKPVRVGFLEARPLGHLALNLDLFLRRRQLNEYPKDAIYLFFIYHAANRQLLKMFKRQFYVCEFYWLGRLLSLLAILNTKFFQKLNLENNEYKEYQNTYCELRFSAQEERQGEEGLKLLGLPIDAWFVCIFSRDSAHDLITYGSNSSTMLLRDGDIDTYKKAAEYIVSKGGYVIRMGKNVAKPFGYKNPNVIDYAVNHRSDFMDVYLTAKCKFYIGTASGGADMARIFDKPHLAVNWIQIGWAPWGKNEIYIPKTLCYRESGKQVPYRQALHLTSSWRTSLGFDLKSELDRLKLDLVNNTPEQILEGTKEMFARLEGTFDRSCEYATAMEKYFELRHETNHFCRFVYSPVVASYVLSLRLE